MTHQIIRKGNQFYIEVTRRFLFLRFRGLLSYSIFEPSFADGYTEFIERIQNYTFPSYQDAESFVKWHRLSGK